LKSVLRIIFDELDLGLTEMWSSSGDTRRDMIKIIFMLYFLKCRL